MASVLIIEDDPNVRGQYASALKKRGYQVVQARDAQEGVQALDIAAPDVVLLDMLMPGGTGVSLLERADLANRYPKTKVVVASNVERSEFADLDKFKIDRYVVKAEVTPHTLADVVDDVLGVTTEREASDGNDDEVGADSSTG